MIIGVLSAAEEAEYGVDSIVGLAIVLLKHLACLTII